MPQPPPLGLYRFWLTDEVTGKRRLTRHRMTEADAPAQGKLQLRGTL